MINYWLSQSKSIRKDLFNLFIGSYLLHGDYGKCTCWIANSSPPPAPKMSDFTSSLEEAHELLQIYFSRKWASPPENIYITKNPHGSSLMLVGSGVKGNSKTAFPLPPCCWPLGRHREGFPPGEGQPHSSVRCWRCSETPGEGGEQPSGPWISQQEPEQAALASTTDYFWESENPLE